MPRTISSFEAEVRRIVRRGSKSYEYESSIEEVAAHFSDLVEEEKAGGKSEHDALFEARKRIGSPSTIALQILNSSDRISKGVRLQRWVTFGLYLVACYYVALSYSALRGWQGQPLSFFGYLFFASLFASGLLYGYGAMLAKKIEWKPILAVIPAVTMTMTFVHLAFDPFYRSYSTQLGIQSQPRMSFFMALDSALGFTVRFFSIFGILVAIGYLGSSLWIQRLSWFRLQRAR